MNFQLIGHLIGLRYKLLWAKTRTRNGKIALFMAGYLLLVLRPGFSRWWARRGHGRGTLRKAERIAQGVLTALFVSATVTSVVLGFGMNEIFSDTELRRYPLNAAERRVCAALHGHRRPLLVSVPGSVSGLGIRAVSVWRGIAGVGHRWRFWRCLCAIIWRRRWWASPWSGSCNRRADRSSCLWRSWWCAFCRRWPCPVLRKNAAAGRGGPAGAGLHSVVRGRHADDAYGYGGIRRPGADRLVGAGPDRRAGDPGAPAAKNPRGADDAHPLGHALRARRQDVSAPAMRRWWSTGCCFCSAARGFAFRICCRYPSFPSCCSSGPGKPPVATRLPEPWACSR